MVVYSDLIYHIYRSHCMGLIPTKGCLQLVSKVTATSFCRRRLPVVMMRSHMAENLRAATTFIEQGHIRVGPEVISDPAFLVTRTMEDFVTWTDTSAIRKHVLDYNDIVLQADHSDGEIEVKFLRKNGAFFKFPRKDDIAWVNIEDVTLICHPTVCEDGKLVFVNKE